MKEIIAVIRPSQWQKTKAQLLRGGFTAFTVHRVYGRGRQKGLNYLSGSGELEEGIRFLPKKMVTLFVRDEDARAAVEILVQNNQTGEIGDGKIFICPGEVAVRIRTDEKGAEALK